MASRIKLLAVVFLLTLLGGGIAAYKHVKLGIPLLVGDKPAEWLVEAKVSFIATGKPVMARLALPAAAVENKIGIDARSAGYNFITENDKGDYEAVWSADKKEGNQALYYRVRFRLKGIDGGGPMAQGGKAPPPSDPGLSGAAREAAERVILRARELSSTPDTLFVGIFREIKAIEGSQEITLLKKSYEEEAGAGRALTLLGIDLLNMAGVPARFAYGVRLDEVRGGQDVTQLVEYFDGVYWKVRDPDEPASTIDPRKMFVWNRGGGSLFEVGGGAENSQLQFTVTKDVVPLERLTDLSNSGLLVSTIFGLPVSERQVFSFVVLIPLGAFVVVVLRNVVGIATLGTFMPVLLALSLLEIEWKSGLVMFVVIVSLGLYFRFLLSRLNLLVVPRVAACVVIVTILMMVLSVVSWHLGMRDVLKITLFPMIILAWTIERMSLIWEEEGKRNALLQVAGSLVVAVVAYWFMSEKQIRYWAYYFPELLLVLLAGIILLGRYTGYRFTELLRFRSFVRTP